MFLWGTSAKSIKDNRVVLNYSPLRLLAQNVLSKVAFVEVLSKLIRLIKVQSKDCLIIVRSLRGLAIIKVLSNEVRMRVLIINGTSFYKVLSLILTLKFFRFRDLISKFYWGQNGLWVQDKLVIDTLGLCLRALLKMTNIHLKRCLSLLTIYIMAVISCLNADFTTSMIVQNIIICPSCIFGIRTNEMLFFLINNFNRPFLAIEATVELLKSHLFVATLKLFFNSCSQKSFTSLRLTEQVMTCPIRLQ